MELQSKSYIIYPHIARQADFTFDHVHDQHNNGVDKHVGEGDSGKRFPGMGRVIQQLAACAAISARPMVEAMAEFFTRFIISEVIGGTITR
jgi:hypothetical protein